MSRTSSGAFVLGVALSGFFDGILLHQILQWHHLLSLVDGEGLQDPRVQILADGAFHVLMYALTAVGLAMQWKGRRDLQVAGAGRRIWAALLLGFGAWNVADVVVFHWILGIHRIRLDGPPPLPWDIGWLVALGLLPMLAGVAMLRSNRGGGRGLRAACIMAVAVLAGGAWSLQPMQQGYAAVLLRPEASTSRMLAAISEAGGGLVALDRSGQVLIVRLPPGEQGWSLYRAGALLVGSASPAGCATALKVT